MFDFQVNVSNFWIFVYLSKFSVHNITLGRDTYKIPEFLELCIIKKFTPTVYAGVSFGLLW